MVSWHTRPLAVITILATAAIPACSRSSSGIQETAVPVKGWVTNAGQPLKISNPMVGWVEVAFIETKGEEKEAKAGEIFTTHADKNGAFTMSGRLGNDLPSGEVIAWCAEMAKRDRVGFIFERELGAIRNHFETLRSP